MKATKRFSLHCMNVLGGMVAGACLISNVHLFTIVLCLLVGMLVGMMIVGFLF
jgi:hypothetical protein